MANAKKDWAPNEVQKEFMEVLANLGHPATLAEVNAVSGKEFKSGSVNTLVTKGLVETEDVEVAYTETKTFDFNGVKVETSTEKKVARKAYKLV